MLFERGVHGANCFLLYTTQRPKVRYQFKGNSLHLQIDHFHERNSLLKKALKRQMPPAIAVGNAKNKSSRANNNSQNARKFLTHLQIVEHVLREIPAHSGTRS